MTIYLKQASDVLTITKCTYLGFHLYYILHSDVKTVDRWGASELNVLVTAKVGGSQPGRRRPVIS